MDADGMVTDALEDLLRMLDRTGRIERLKMIYTVDYFQNPTGLTLSAGRRERLIDLVRQYSRRHRIVILEDAAYRELRFGGDDLPSIKSFDSGNEHVIYASTFSKPCAPGLRTGIGIVPKGLLAPLLRLKGSHDFGSPNLLQHVIDRLLEIGAYDQQVRTLQGVYREKCRATIDALTSEFREWPAVQWTRPDGGLYVWLTMPESIRTGPGGPLIEACLREGVLYVPGEFCHVAVNGQIPTNEIRLCYGVEGVEQIREAVHRFAKAAKGLLGGRPLSRQPSIV
jgi:2-aminoadipate transaminase